MINTNLDRELHITLSTIWTELSPQNPGGSLSTQWNCLGTRPSGGHRRFSEFMRVGPWLYVTGVLSRRSGSRPHCLPMRAHICFRLGFNHFFEDGKLFKQNVFHLRPLTDNSNSETHWCGVLDFYWARIPMPSTQSSGHRVVWLYAEVPSHPRYLNS